VWAPFRSFRFLAVVWLGTSFLSCAGTASSGERRYLDHPFSSPCAAFEAIARFALSLHVEQEQDDFSSLRSRLPGRLSKALGTDLPDGTTSVDCADIDAIGSLSKVTGPALYQKALEEFVSLLDAHSSYLPPETETKWVRQRRNEGFGIGIAPRRRVIDKWEPIDGIVVEEVFPRSPASGKLEPGEQIVSIGGIRLEGMLFRDAWALLTDTDSDSITLKVEGDSRPRVIPRSSYFAPPVAVKTVRAEGRVIGYLKIREFTEGSARMFESARKKIEAEDHVEGLLLDLRGSPGGLAEEASKVVGSFIGSGVVYTTRGKELPSSGDLNPNGASSPLSGSGASRLPLVVLVDASTASAAEIVAGTLKESGRGLIVGQRTFGKGTGQIPVPLGSRNGLGGRLLLTMFRYYLFNGFSPQLKGIEPHVTIPDPGIQKIIAEGKNKSGAPLHEEDYGDRIVSPAGERGPAPLTPLIRSLQKKILEKDVVCPEETDDCAAKLAVDWLMEAIDLRADWSVPKLRNAADALKLRALDRSREAT
jgi:carboxyl-terminal processing protease